MATLELGRTRRLSIPTPPLTPPPSSTHEATALAELLSSSLLSVPAGDISERDQNDPVYVSTQPDAISSSPTGAGISTEQPMPIDNPPDLNGSVCISRTEELTSERLEDNQGCELVGDSHAITSSTVAVSDVQRSTVSTFSDGATQAPQVLMVEVESPIAECDCWDKKFLLSKNRLKKKFYVGKMRLLPCPPSLTARWESEIYPRLMNDLLAVLSWSTPNEFFEAELRMAGYARNERTARLKPTVCIRCTSKGCRKDFEKAVKDLDYLNSFSQGNVEVRLGAPRLATSGNEFPEQRECVVQWDRRLQVQDSTSGSSACGLKLRVVAETGSKTYENISTIGGLVNVNNKVYGLTTAHGILSLPGIAALSTTDSSDCSDSDSSAYLDSDSESLDDLDATPDTSLLDKHRRPGANRLGLNARPNQTLKTEISEQPEWKNVTFCGPMCFCGRGSVTGGTNEYTSSRTDMDFALIDMGLSTKYQLYNEYTYGSGQNLPKIQIDGIKNDEDLKAGEVILLIGQNQVRAGHLLDGTAFFRNKAMLVKTMKIELDVPLRKCYKYKCIEPPC